MQTVFATSIRLCFVPYQDADCASKPALDESSGTTIRSGAKEQYRDYRSIVRWHRQPREPLSLRCAEYQRSLRFVRSASIPRYEPVISFSAWIQRSFALPTMVDYSGRSGPAQLPGLISPFVSAFPQMPSLAQGHQRQRTNRSRDSSFRYTMSRFPDKGLVDTFVLGLAFMHALLAMVIGI